MNEKFKRKIQLRSGLIQEVYDSGNLKLFNLEKLIGKRKNESLQGFPTFVCRVDGIHLLFYCPFCKEEHVHGLAGVAPNEFSHRSSHCKSESGKLAMPRGYLIGYITTSGRYL